MIPQAYIDEWGQLVPWQAQENVEQDLAISRALVEIFSDDFLAERLAFRGGTALHKLFLHPQPRYSEDIDLVQRTSGDIGPVLTRIRERLEFLGRAGFNSSDNINTLVYKFESEGQPPVRLKLKVEINCREHFTVLGWKQVPFAVESQWYAGTCQITTYELEELLGTKLRALFQRRKGRDLFDLHWALTSAGLDAAATVRCFQHYMDATGATVPSRQEFISNLESKLEKAAFSGDTRALLRPDVPYDPAVAYQQVRDTLLNLLG